MKMFKIVLFLYLFLIAVILFSSACELNPLFISMLRICLVPLIAWSLSFYRFHNKIIHFISYQKWSYWTFLALLRYNWYNKNCTHLIYAFWLVWATTIIMVVNISISPNFCFLFCCRCCLVRTLNMKSVFLTHFNKCHIANCRRRQWHPTPVLLPGKSHGWRSLVGCSPWGR